MYKITIMFKLENQLFFILKLLICGEGAFLKIDVIYLDSMWWMNKMHGHGGTKKQRH